ncbi:Lipase_3 domain-containing protein [Durusdinium trenchii]|uniref:Lipase_3 domain-containing protein n=1 Tax=Durusdinium trenchii TaxID=1381693 RepID=A0ABP0H509_9DINO
MHKAFSVLVRVCSNLLDTRGDITRKWQQYQECLGRLPLIFCLQLLRPWQSHPGIQSTRLFFAEAPPPVSGGPVPQHFLNATTRLQMGRCVVLHAALGGAPSNVALRSALGPLQRLAQKEKVPESGTIPDVPVVSWDLQCLCRALVLQAEKAAQEGSAAIRAQALMEPEMGPLAAVLHASALQRGIRQITQTELRRQYPLAILRSQSLRASEPAALEEALRLLEGFEGVETERNGELLVDVAGLAWQQQWQVRHLVGCIHAAEARGGQRRMREGCGKRTGLKVRAFRRTKEM